LSNVYYCYDGLVKKKIIRKTQLKNQLKKPSQNGWDLNDLSKMARWSSWTRGKKPYGGFSY